MKMKKLQGILFIVILFTGVFNATAQRDTLKLQREARALLRAGNKLYNKQKFGDAAIAYRKALDKDTPSETNGQGGQED